MLLIQLLLPSAAGLNIETIKTTLITELARFFECAIPVDKVQVTFSRGRETAVQVTQSAPFGTTLVTRGHERFNAFKWTVITAVNSGLRRDLRLNQGPFHFATGTPGLFEGTSGADGANPIDTGSRGGKYGKSTSKRRNRGGSPFSRPTPRSSRPEVTAK